MKLQLLSDLHLETEAFDPEPAWVFDVPGRGTPVIHDGRVYVFSYRIFSNADVRQYLTALDEATVVFGISAGSTSR